MRADDIQGAELDRAGRIDTVLAIPFSGETVGEDMTGVAQDKAKACTQPIPMDEPYRFQQAALTDMGPCPAKTPVRTVFEAVRAWVSILKI